MSAFTTAIHRYTLRGHVLQFSTYADETARLAATGFIADSVGRVYRQVSDGTFWLLLNHSPITWVQVDIGTEVAAARAPFATLAEHVNNNTQLAASCYFPSPILNTWFDNSWDASSATSRAGAANRLELGPLTLSRRTRIDELGVYVVTGVASSNVKICIYEPDADGWPDTVLHESADVVTDTSSVLASAACDLTFDAGVIYWVGCRYDSTQTISVLPIAGCRSFGKINSTNTINVAALRRTVTYANPLPDPFGIADAHRVANIGPPSIRMRAVAF